MSTVRNRRRRNNSESESQLISEYMDLLRVITRTNNESFISLNNNTQSMLSNLHLLFDNYYRWGRESREYDNTSTSRSFLNTYSTNNSTGNQSNLTNNRINSNTSFNWDFDRSSRRNVQSPINTPLWSKWC